MAAGQTKFKIRTPRDGAAKFTEPDTRSSGSAQSKMADRISQLARAEPPRDIYGSLAGKRRNWESSNLKIERRDVWARCLEALILLLRMKTLIFAAIFVLLTRGCHCYRDQKFAMEPQDQSAIISERVTLPCRVEGKSGHLQWTKDDFGLGTHRNLSGYDRYKMIGSDEEGDFSLDIMSVTLEDDASYQCQVSSGPEGQPPIRSRYAKLTVLVPPEPPRILQGSFLATTEDREVELECLSVGGKPAADLMWLDGQGVITQGIKLYNETFPDKLRTTVRSVLKLTPRREHHKQVFKCQSMHPAVKSVLSANITLEVKYAPKVRVSVVSGATSGGRIPEGNDVKISCKADANPETLSYKWYLNDEPVIGDFTTELMIYNISRKYHDSIVKCEVHNSVGKSEESEILDVSYAPKFKNRPSNVEAEPGATAVLSCDVDGNPLPEIYWLHQEQERTTRVGRAPNLTISLTDSTAGRYICKASVPGYEDIEADATVYVKGPPHIVSHRTQFGVQGDNVRVECTAFSVPKPGRIVWTYNGREVNAAIDQDYAFLEDVLPEGVVKSTLIIRESQPRHFGTYNCSITNDYGSDRAEIVLKPHKSFPLLLILFGVTAGIIVIAAFVMLVILCQRKRRRKEQTGGKKPDVMADLGHNGTGAHKESDRSSNISDLKLELRQADGVCELDYSSQDYSCTGSETALHNNMLSANIGLGLPLAGPVPLPSTDHANALIMQYTRYSNDYSDPAFNMAHYKDGHNNNGYVPYVDYSREYAPPVLHLQSPPHAGNEMHSAHRIQLSSLHSASQLNALNTGSLSGSLTRSVDTASTAPYGSQNNSLQRNKESALNSLGLPATNDGTPSPMYSQHGSLKLVPNGVMSNGVDVRYAATYGNPYLRAGSGLGQVNTAKPGSTPAPPPYSAIRSSVVLPPSVSLTSPSSVSSSQYTTSPGVSSSGVTVGSAQPQVARSSSLLAPQSPGSQYILPPSSQASTQGITKKGNGNQSSLATHV